MEINERIKLYIRGVGLKQCAVAAKAGYTDRQFSLMMTGKKPLLAKDVQRICAVLDVEPSEFIKPHYSTA